MHPMNAVANMQSIGRTRDPNRRAVDFTPAFTSSTRSWHAYIVSYTMVQLRIYAIVSTSVIPLGQAWNSAHHTVPRKKLPATFVSRVPVAEIQPTRSPQFIARPVFPPGLFYNIESFRYPARPEATMSIASSRDKYHEEEIFQQAQM